jgi:hypothetical protein
MRFLVSLQHLRLFIKNASTTNKIFYKIYFNWLVLYEAKGQKYAMKAP